MNFDMNAMMNLMQMMGGGGSFAGGKNFMNGSESCPDGKGENSASALNFNSPPNGSADMMKNLMSMFLKGENSFGNARQTTRNDPSASSGTSANSNAKDFASRRPFAAQNGLGEQIDPFKGQRPQENKQDGNADMMSNLLPMLMNMMSQNRPSAKTAEAEHNETNNGNNSIKKEEDKENALKDVEYSYKTDEKQNESESEGINHSGRNERIGNFGFGKQGTSDIRNCANASKNNSGKTNCNPNINNAERFNANGNSKRDIKTQSGTRKDMYEPIAFAGYGLKSALNKLYFTSRRRLRREDVYRKEQ